jgi:hypothetical protein
MDAGTVEYYYSEVDTWHTTHTNRVEVFHFPSGQREAHHPTGLREILFPDSSVRLVCADGAEVPAERSQLSPEALQDRPKLDSEATAALRTSFAAA